MDNKDLLVQQSKTTHVLVQLRTKETLVSTHVSIKITQNNTRGLPKVVYPVIGGEISLGLVQG